MFVTEFEYCDDPVFLGRIGILGRPSRGFSYVPWCPSYPADLFEDSESSEHDGSLSWSDGEPSDLDEGDDFQYDNSEEEYIANLQATLP